jgi:hypothetical protein
MQRNQIAAISRQNHPEVSRRIADSLWMNRTSAFSKRMLARDQAEWNPLSHT